MQRIFDAERRRNGGFARGPVGIGPQSPLKASKMLDGGLHHLVLFSCSTAIVTPTQHRVLMLNRP